MFIFLIAQVIGLPAGEAAFASASKQTDPADPAGLERSMAIELVL